MEEREKITAAPLPCGTQDNKLPGWNGKISKLTIHIYTVISGILIIVFCFSLYLLYENHKAELQRNFTGLMGAAAPAVSVFVRSDGSRDPVPLQRILSHFPRIKRASFHSQADQLAYSYPELSSVRPPISNATGITLFNGDFRLNQTLLMGDNSEVNYQLEIDGGAFFQRLMTQSLLYLLIYSLFILLSYRFFKHKITRPAQTILDNISLLGTGRVDLSNANNTHNEIQQLALALTQFDSELARHKQRSEKLNQNLSKQTQDLENALNVKNLFMANMSHEIRTPMNSIIGFTTCLEELPLNTEESEYVKYIKDSSKLLLHIINEILDYSKLESGNIALEIRPFNLYQLCQDTIAQQQIFSADKSLNVRLIYELDRRQYLLGDKFRLNQILNNLLSNAVKFTHNGEVVLRISTLHENSKSITLDFSVKDTGVGIAPEHIKHIFNSYSQADNSISRCYGGTGLGLAISQQLALLMNSSIKVTSQLNQGSTFHFTVAFDKVSAAQRPERRREQVSTDQLYKTLKILIAEDNKINQVVIETLLNKLGMTNTTIAQNGKEALALLDQSSFDMILMDCQMPEMDGITATQQIRQRADQNADITIIALTANATAQDKQACASAGMNDFLPKPVNKTELLRVIQKNMPLH